jgi:hypothetical protein
MTENYLVYAPDWNYIRTFEEFRDWQNLKPHFISQRFQFQGWRDVPLLFNKTLPSDIAEIAVSRGIQLVSFWEQKQRRCEAKAVKLRAELEPILDFMLLENIPQVADALDFYNRASYYGEWITGLEQISIVYRLAQQYGYLEKKSEPIKVFSVDLGGKDQTVVSLCQSMDGHLQVLKTKFLT